jgi:hypothetical protein
MSVWSNISEYLPSDPVVLGEDCADGAILAIKASDGKAYNADITNADLLPAAGGAATAGIAGDTVLIVTRGWRTDGSSLTVGDNVYLAHTAGAVTSALVGVTPQVVGYAVTAAIWSFAITPVYPVPTYT